MRQTRPRLDVEKSCPTSQSGTRKRPNSAPIRRLSQISAAMAVSLLLIAPRSRSRSPPPRNRTLPSRARSTPTTASAPIRSPKHQRAPQRRSTIRLICRPQVPDAGLLRRHAHSHRQLRRPVHGRRPLDSGAIVPVRSRRGGHLLDARRRNWRAPSISSWFQTTLKRPDIVRGSAP
jgi:hypothetical protein